MVAKQDVVTEEVANNVEDEVFKDLDVFEQASISDSEAVESSTTAENMVQDEVTDSLISTEEVDLVDNVVVTDEVQVSKDLTTEAHAKEAVDSSGSVKASPTCEPQFATVYTTAVIENSPYSSFSQDEWESIGRFATNKDHLRKNISNLQYCRSSTRNIGNNLFEHIVEIQILVSIESLWQSPRAYLWKHIGQDYWERGNGSKIRLTKIHQK